MKMRTMNTCCICGRKYEGYGNDPWPVEKEQGKRCCDECNMNVVVAERIKIGKEGQTRTEKKKSSKQ